MNKESYIYIDRLLYLLDQIMSTVADEGCHLSSRKAFGDLLAKMDLQEKINSAPKE